MVRKQVYIEARQEQLLKAHAKDLRVTEAELIRRGIDRGLDRAGGIRPDPAAWSEAERFQVQQFCEILEDRSYFHAEVPAGE